MESKRAYIQLTKRYSIIQLNKEYRVCAMTVNAYVTDIGLLHMSLSEKRLQISGIQNRKIAR
jgi:hypothetical protein